MGREWILIANTSMARLFSRGSDSDPLVPLHTFERSQKSRDAAAEPIHDGVGAGAAGPAANGIGTLPRAISPKRKKHLEFAHELAQRLDEGLARGECDRITLYAACPFVGELKGQLSRAAKKAVRGALDVDLTGYALHELEQRIAHQLPTLDGQRRG
jgi:hypothetical protein